MSTQQSTGNTWGVDLYRQAVRDRIPIAASVALTHRCNLRCIHCYLQNSRDVAQLSANDWMKILEEMAEAGCLWLTITGGEPLVHPDFEKIYQHAKKLGFLVTVFTNGTLIDKNLIELFDRWPPRSVEISLYGHSRETYEAVTGSARARDEVVEAIDALLARDVHLALKTVALRDNISEIESIRDRCRRWGIALRVDPMVTPCLDGTTISCSSRLDEQATIRIDTEDPKRAKAWVDCLQEEHRIARTTLFSCGAGLMAFHVHPDGQMALCIDDVGLFDLRIGSVLEGWNGPIRERRQTPLPATHECSECRDQVFCGTCPPRSRMETGDDLGFVEHICRLGRSRREAAQQCASTRNHR